MAGTQRLLATVMAFSLVSVSAQGRSDVLGVVAHADDARLGSVPVADGTTIYDGDSLATGTSGSLQLLIGDAMLYLSEQSSVVIRSHTSGAAKEFQTEVFSGAVVLSLTAKIAGEVLASSASVRPLAETRGVVRVQISGPHELIVFAQRGPAQISYGGESEIVPTGKSYRVLLSSEDDKQSGGTGPKKPVKHRKAILLIALGAGAVALATAIPLLTGSSNRGANKGVESPDRP